jgi:Co/Zn/Cd efflux system component
MADCCSGAACAPTASPRYRRILWIALTINGAMFCAELAGSWHASSSSLLADSVDFFADAANYGISLLVLSMAAMWRARAALFKGVTMGVVGLLVLGQAIAHAFTGVLPHAGAMGTLGIIALCANLLCAALLYAYRDGDANMRSVWLCTRNDAIGNCAVMLAALGVAGSNSGWPDVLVAMAMGLLAVRSAISVVTLARIELAAQHTTAATT